MLERRAAGLAPGTVLLLSHFATALALLLCTAAAQRNTQVAGAEPEPVPPSCATTSSMADASVVLDVVGRPCIFVGEIY